MIQLPPNSTAAGEQASLTTAIRTAALYIAADGEAFPPAVLSAVGKVAFPPFLYCFLFAAVTDADVAVSVADKSSVFVPPMPPPSHEATSVTDATVATVAAWSIEDAFFCL